MEVGGAEILLWLTYVVDCCNPLGKWDIRALVGG